MITTKEILNVLVDVDAVLSRILLFPEYIRPYLFAIEWTVHGIPWLIFAFMGTTVSMTRPWSLEIQHNFVILTFGLLLDLILVGVLKVGIQRRRPPTNIDDGVLEAPIADQFSFPSGHSSRAAMLVVLLQRVLPSANIPASLLLLLIGTSRISMGRHYLSDVLAGFALGWLEGELAVRLPGPFTSWIRRSIFHMSLKNL